MSRTLLVAAAIASLFTTAAWGDPPPKGWSTEEAQSWTRGLAMMLEGQPQKLQPADYRLPMITPVNRALGFYEDLLPIEPVAMPENEPTPAVIGRGMRADYPGLSVSRYRFPDADRAFQEGTRLMRILADPAVAHQLAQRFEEDPLLVEVRGDEVLVLEGPTLRKDPVLVDAIRQTAWGAGPDPKQQPAEALGVFSELRPDCRRAGAIDLAEPKGPLMDLLRSTRDARRGLGLPTGVTEGVYEDEGPDDAVTSVTESPDGVSLSFGDPQGVADIARRSDLHGGRRPLPIGSLADGRRVFASPGADGRTRIRVDSPRGPNYDAVRDGKITPQTLSSAHRSVLTPEEHSVLRPHGGLIDRVGEDLGGR